MPENDTPDAETQEILQRADAADVGTPNRVGALYRQIIDLVATLDDDDLCTRGLDLTVRLPIEGRNVPAFRPP